MFLGISLVYVVESFPGLCDRCSGFMCRYGELDPSAFLHGSAQLLFCLEKSGSAVVAHFFFPECPCRLPFPLLPAQRVYQPDGCEGACFVNRGCR